MLSNKVVFIFVIFLDIFSEVTIESHCIFSKL